MNQRSNPFNELERFFENMSRQFDESTPDLGMESRLSRWTPTRERMSIDMIDHDDDLVVTVDVPGYDQDEIDISVFNRRLRIAADHEETTEVDEESYLRRERRHETMRRTIDLPVEIDPEDVSATLTNGVLTITLPKQMVEQARTIEIK